MAHARPSVGSLDVVIIDADPGQRRALAELIAERGSGRFTTRAYASAAEGLAAADGGGTIMIADLETVGGPGRLPEMAKADVPLIATSANGSLNAAVAALKGGAVDFLAKPIGARALIERLEAALADRARRSPVAESRPAAAAAATDFAGFIGRSAAMRAVYEQVKRMARSRAPVFITGESGTGKELCAEAIHASSRAARGRLVAINCSAIPKDLMESEIFGHLRGAFTGAIEDRVGAAELADKGTLFLDEVGEMDFGLQAKLLRFVQSGSVCKVGGTETERVDVRIVCATNRDPLREVDAGRFRADLFYRLHVLPIHLAPLRQRRDDILPLARAFLECFSAEEQRRFRNFSDEAEARLTAYDWPGNVRQLANVVRRVVVLGDGVRVTAAMLAAVMGEAGSARKVASNPARGARPDAIGPLWQQERRIIEGVLAAFGGSITQAAAALEISPSTIYRKRQSWSERAQPSH